jgi:DTW domain-containing protein YfiP
MIVSCKNCLKPISICFCSEIQPIRNETTVLILQHPQEPNHELGSARIAHLALENSHLKIGLSWKNLSAALGKPADSAEWAVLYLGSGVKGDAKPEKGLQFLSKKGLPIAGPEVLKGIVILDGTWSQSKALWWRNPWLLKLRRAILTPRTPSKYGYLRKEPRKECLSTLESIAETLTELGEAPEIKTTLHKHFARLLERYQESKK